MTDNCWLPEIIEYSPKEYETWMIYYDYLYEIFKEDFIESKPFFKGKPINIRKHPIEYGKEEAFFHVTCQDYQHKNDRAPDLRRCERIRWIRAFIENYNCDPSFCYSCEGIKIWPEKQKGKDRINFFLEEERYIVIVEKRDNYYLLITAFYLEYDHSINKKIKQYKRYIDSIQ